MVKWLIASVAAGIIGGEATLGLIFPEPQPVSEGCCEGWKPCPGRKPVREHGHKYVWYCGPDPQQTEEDRERAIFMEESAAQRRTAPRTDRGRADAKGHR